MRKKCIFCRRDDQKITKEHVFPDWLSELFGDSFTAINEGTTSEGKVLYRYESKVFQQTVNTVCKSCNNNWMSEIENQAKPILTKMLRDKNIVLDKKSQLKIATWAMKTILVMNHDNPKGKSIIPQGHYDRFYSTKTIGNESLMLLGYNHIDRLKPGDRLASNWLAVTERMSVHKDVSEEDMRAIMQEPTTYGATLSLANIVFQLIGHKAPSTINLEVAVPDEPMRVINSFQKKVRWPLPHTINEVGGLAVIHEALKGGPT